MALDLAATVVYVLGDGTTYHLDQQCRRGLTDRTGGGAGISACSAGAAHRSCLRPCPTCATDLAKVLTQTLGAIPSGERRRRSRPTLQPLRGTAPALDARGSRFTARSGGTVVEADTPYGAPIAADDLRFANQSNAGWGTASYGQNVDEFLGEGTDDDNDWRGASRYMD